jgi:hypothetical protein
MINEDDNTTYEDDQAAPAGKGPFGVAPVDALVFRDTDEAPEARAAAALVRSPQAHVEQTPAPAKRAKESYTSWTPEGATLAATTPETVVEAPTGNRTSAIFTSLVILIPVVLLGGAVYLGLLLTNVI